MKCSTTFCQGSCYDLHHHLKRHQTLVVHFQHLIYPIPYMQPTPLHRLDQDLDALLQSLPVCMKSAKKRKGKRNNKRFLGYEIIQFDNFTTDKKQPIKSVKPWERNSAMSFLAHQALQQIYALHKLHQLHAVHHNFKNNIEQKLRYPPDSKKIFLKKNILSNKEPTKRPTIYQNVNFGDESSFWIDWKSKIDLENREKTIRYGSVKRRCTHTSDT